MARRPRRRPSTPKRPASSTTVTIRRPVRRRRKSRRKTAPGKTPVSYNHRTHPSKVNRQPPGHCRWCGVKIYKKDGVTLNLRRSWCGQTCVSQYLLRSDPKVMRQHVFFRDEGKCSMCGRQWRYMSDPWQADHTEPLFMAFGDWSFWEPENVTVMCADPCHKIKSANDMAKYGFVLKAGKEKPKTKRVSLAERLKD